MKRITVKLLRERVEFLYNLTGVPMRLDVQHDDGTRCRVQTTDKGRDVSPRLCPRDMDNWIDGFRDGWNEMERKQKEVGQ